MGSHVFGVDVYPEDQGTVIFVTGSEAGQFLCFEGEEARVESSRDSKSGHFQRWFLFAFIALVGICVGTFLFSPLPLPAWLFMLPLVLSSFTEGGEPSSISSLIDAIAPLSLVAPPLLFVPWSWQLARGESLVPTRTKVVLPALLLGNAWYLVSQWDAAILQQGFSATVSIVALNAALMSVLALTYFLAVLRPSYPKNFALHFFAFVWLLAAAIPWLGEGL